MKYILAMVAVIICTSSASTVNAENYSVQSTKTFDMPLDQAWAKITKYLVLHSITPTLSDKETGVINAEGTNGIKYVNCDAGKGKLVDVQYKAGISIDSKGANTVSVTIVVDGDGKYARRHHILFIPTATNKKPTECTTKGVFERNLFDYLATQ